jgi:hypothetical protein
MKGHVVPQAAIDARVQAAHMFERALVATPNHRAGIEGGNEIGVTAHGMRQEHETLRVRVARFDHPANVAVEVDEVAAAADDDGLARNIGVIVDDEGVHAGVGECRECADEDQAIASVPRIRVKANSVTTEVTKIFGHPSTQHRDFAVLPHRAKPSY